MSISHPDHDSAYETFQLIREYREDCPIVGACRNDDVFRIARFLTNGLRSYVLRETKIDNVCICPPGIVGTTVV